MKIARGNGKQRMKHFFAECAVVLGVVIITGTPVWAASAGGHGEGGWQATDWYRVMNFAVLAIGLFLLLRKPASQALSSRIKGIAQELEQLEARRKTAEKQLVEYTDRLALLDKEAEKIVAEYQRQGEEAKARILKEAQASAEKLRQQARKNIDHEFKQAKLDLQQDVVAKALARAEQLIANRINAEDQKNLVDEYLNKVVA
ncbi:MAG: hypothetical protein C4519_05265 [Desulfobacteraceae bacterium]|nr:MAG: hypothetical protein C4519_05265 [Desulfobacteraceae bacterium]